MPKTLQTLTKPFENIGLRGRLLLAFLGISAFAVLAAVAGMASFSAVGKVLDLIAHQRVPSALASLDLSRQAERIVAAAPILLAAQTPEQHSRQSRTISEEVEQLDVLLSDLKRGTVDVTELARLETAAGKLRGNIKQLDNLVARNLNLQGQKKKLLGDANAANGAIQRLLKPWVLVTESKMLQLQQMAEDPALVQAERSAALLELVEANKFRERLQQAQLDASIINDTLLQSAVIDQPDHLTVTQFRLRHQIEALTQLASGFDEKLLALLSVQIESFRNLTEGTSSLPGLRKKEIEQTLTGERLLDENIELVRELTAAVDHLVGVSKSDIELGNLQAQSVQRLSSGVLIATVILSVVSSTLIVWLYVGRNIVARLTALSSSMLSIADGKLRTPLPPGGGDEVGQMADALRVFRDTAVVREIFGKYVPKSVADAIIAGKGSLQPVQTIATVLYSDLESFTSIAESMTPRQVVQMLNEYFPAVIEPLNLHGGTVNQFQGDAMLVTFNVPIEDPHHADEAVAAACEIQKIVKGRTFAGVPLRTRIGINTGTVIAGNVGAGDRINYTVHGDAVNLAARIEQLNKDYGTLVLVSGTTVSLLSGNYPMELVGEVDIRGKQEPVKLFKLGV